MPGRTWSRAAAAGLAALWLSGCDPLTADELTREIDQIHSLAAEGAVLADGVRADRTRATFTRVHARELADSADESAQKLNDATEAPGLADDVEGAIELAGDVSQALGDLETSPGDEATGGDAAKRLRDLADRADRLADGL